MSIAIAGSLKGVLQAAAAESQRRHHPQTTLDHLLEVLLRDPPTVEILRRCGCDLAHLRSELSEYLELLPERPEDDYGGPLPDAGYRLVVERALRRMLVSGRQELGAVDVLVELLGDGDSYAAMLLRAEGMTRLDLERCVSHGSLLPSLGSLPSEAFVPTELLEVILHNDHYTHMEFVIRVLREVFGCSDKEAAALMLQVHQQGRAAVGHYPGDVAKRKAELVLAMAKGAGFPLHCSVEFRHRGR